MAYSETTRYDLRKPDPNDLYDVGIANFNMDALDKVGGITRVTSSTRPSTPLADQAIYETDTGRIMVWNAAGPAWVNLPLTADRPLVGGKRYDGSSAVLTTLPNSTVETLTGMDTGSLALEANTSYSVKAAIDWDSTVAADRFDFRLRLTNVSGTVIALVNNQLFQTSAIRETLYMDGLLLQGSAGSVTVVATMQRRSGTGTGRIYKSTTTLPWIRIEKMGATSLLTQV